MAQLDNTSQDVAPGSAAIATALAEHYGYQTSPTHWGTSNSMRSGGDDPLEGVSAFDAGDHWHYVSYGLTQLEESDGVVAVGPGISGYGFELSFRLAAFGRGSPPEWPVLVLQQLAKYVFRSANVFRPGDHMNLNAPIGGQHDTKIEAALFAEDPDLPPASSVFGEFSFVQVVGVTRDELDAVRDWQCEAFLQLMARTNPKLVTNLYRDSLLRDPNFRSACLRGTHEEGSSLGSAFAPMVRWEGTQPLTLSVSAIAVPDLQRMLRLRLPFNRPFKLQGPKHKVRFVPSLEASVADEGRHLKVNVPWDCAAAMSHVLRPERGVYAWPGIPDFAIKVVPTDVRGPRGELVRVIG